MHMPKYLKIKKDTNILRKTISDLKQSLGWSFIIQ